MIRCPECNTEVQPDWDWCHACGWDPEGLRPDRAAAAHASYPPMRPGPSAGSSTGRTIAVALLAIFGGAVALVAVLVLAVTFLGTPVEQDTFASVDGAIDPAERRSPTRAAGEITGPDGAPVDGATWTRYTSPDGAFSLEFPGAAVEEVHPAEDGTQTFLIVQTDLGTSGYVALYLELAPGYQFPDQEVMLKDLTSRLGDSMGIAFSSQTPGTFATFPSRSLTGSIDGGAATVQGVAFASGQRFFLLMTAAYQGDLVHHDRFVDSFVAG